MVRIIALALALLSFAALPSRAEVAFDTVNGSDLGMGVGARAIGMGGAYTAVANDPSATFWNPAGLTLLESSQFSFSADLPHDFSACSLIYKPSFWQLPHSKTAVGLSFINRLRIQGDSGSCPWAGRALQILDLGTIEVGEGFSGSLESQTYDTRLSISFEHPAFPRLSIGVNLIHVC